MTKLYLPFAAATALTLISFPTLVITGQTTSDTQAVTPIGKAPLLPDDKPKKADAAPTGVYFADGFSGSQLGPEWKVMNGDATGWALQPKQKSLLVITRSGLLTDSKNLKNWFILNKDLPADDFEVIAEVSLQIQGVGNSAGLAIYRDDQNFFWVGFQGDPWGNNIARTPYFAKMFEGKSTNLTGERRYGVASEPEHLFLKFERESNQYSGSYAYTDRPLKLEEVQWTRLGTLPWIKFKGKLALVGANFQDAPEVSAEFHSVLIRRK